MGGIERRGLRVFVDADVTFAGSASPGEHSASQVVLALSEITLVDAFASEQVIAECERNLGTSLPDALSAFRLLASRALHVVPDPPDEAVAQHGGLADSQGRPIL